MNYKTPLAVYIIWHPKYKNGNAIANYLYESLCRDVKRPLVRSLGIPVYFRCANFDRTDKPINIDFEESEHTAIVALISDEFVLSREYEDYIEKLYESCIQYENRRRIYPVALSKNAFNVSKHISAINFITIELGTNIPIERIAKQIKTPILHELCRLLMKMKPAAEETNNSILYPPVKLFISHSKHDESKQDALKFRDYINSQTQLKTFFDANDIAFGSNFGEEIKNAARESALVVFQSDSYADREWCRIEVITAKSHGCPIVIVNAVKEREKRAFPYLGNYPSIRFNENHQEIIDLTLEQVLANKHLEYLLDSLTDLYNIKLDAILSNVPELFDFIRLRKKCLGGRKGYSIVIYPDPPLGSEEMDILNQLDDNFIFITPLMLPAISMQNEQTK